jgi:class 3 adenylate cyclase
MKFDDDWNHQRTLDAYSIRDDEVRFDRVARATIVCTDIVGGARLFETLPRDRFDGLLRDYLCDVRGVFGGEQIYHTLRDDIFVVFEGETSDALVRALAFVEGMRRSPFECSVGIACGDVAIVTKGEAAESQGPTVAIAKGLAKIAAARAIFIDNATARTLAAHERAPLTEAQSVRLPHVGQALLVREALGSEGRRGLKSRFAAMPRIASYQASLRA